MQVSQGTKVEMFMVCFFVSVGYSVQAFWPGIGWMENVCVMVIIRFWIRTSCATMIPSGPSKNTFAKDVTMKWTFMLLFISLSVCHNPTCPNSLVGQHIFTEQVCFVLIRQKQQQCSPNVHLSVNVTLQYMSMYTDKGMFMGPINVMTQACMLLIIHV